jgi:hypothetical protein
MLSVPNLETLLASRLLRTPLAGCLLLLSWLQSRNIIAQFLWGVSFLATAVATVLIICVGRDCRFLVDYY